MVEILLPKNTTVRTGLEKMLVQLETRMAELGHHNEESQKVFLDAGYKMLMIDQILRYGGVNTEETKKELQALTEIGCPPINPTVFIAAEKFLADYCKTGVTSHET